MAPEGTTANFVSTLGLEPEPFHTVAGRRSSVVGDAHDFQPAVRDGLI